MASQAPSFAMAMPARPAGFPAGPFLDSYDFADPKGGRMAPDQLVGAPFDARVFPRPGGSGNVPRARARRDGAGQSSARGGAEMHAGASQIVARLLKTALYLRRARRREEGAERLSG